MKIAPYGLALAAAVLPWWPASGAETPTAAGISIAGAALGAGVQPRVTVERQQGQVDAARIAFTGPRGAAYAATLEPGDDVTIEARVPGAGAGRIFSGEIVGIEPWRCGPQPFVVVRSFDRLHRLAREPKTRVFEDATLAGIVAAIAAEHGLQADASSVPDVRLDRVFQHNQTDLEFLNERARAVGHVVATAGSTLLLRPAPGDRASVSLTPGPSGDARLRIFLPKLSSTQSLQEVRVAGVDARTGERIIARSAAPTIGLGDGVAELGERFGTAIDVEVEPAPASQQEADALASSLLQELTADRVSAEAMIGGHPALDVGTRSAVEGVGSEFDGTYRIIGVSHRFKHPAYGAYAAVLRLLREDRGMYFIPEIDDEVLVGFEHGDLNRPVVLGSLWNSRDGTRAEACEEGDRLGQERG